MAKKSSFTQAVGKVGSTGIPKLAIACQGGGAHTAFSAGVLSYFFLAFQHFQDKNQALPVELTALSGTSGGAITAAMAWSDPGKTKEPWAEGARRMLRFWHLNKALAAPENPHPLWWFESGTNLLAQWAAAFGNVLPKVQLPANPETSRLVKARMTEDMKTAFGAACREGKIAGRPSMRIYIGTCDIVNKTGRPDTAFTAFPLQAGAPLEIGHLLASAAIPEIFTPEEILIDGEPRLFWDGLFSQNPPINNFFHGHEREAKPELLWVIQINPGPYEPANSEAYPKLPLEVEDRRNELIGNLSLGHELNTIETINALYAEPPEGLKDRKPVIYSLIPLGRLHGKPLDYASKMNRDPAFIDALIRHGAATAHEKAKSGALFSPVCHQSERGKPAKCWLNPPDWPTPASLAKYLEAEPDLQGIWRDFDLRSRNHFTDFQAAPAFDRPAQP
jgi:NTE family protein